MPSLPPPISGRRAGTDHAEANDLGGPASGLLTGGGGGGGHGGAAACSSRGLRCQTVDGRRPPSQRPRLSWDGRRAAGGDVAPSRTFARCLLRFVPPLSVCSFGRMPLLQRPSFPIDPHPVAVKPWFLFVDCDVPKSGARDGVDSAFG